VTTRHQFVPEAEASRSWIEHGGCGVCWHCRGSGRPLVLLHGGFGSWRHWERNLDALAARHMVCVPDLPGYGESDDPNPSDLPTLLDATVATLDALVGAGTAIDLAGFSFGGVVAAHLARSRGRVRRLALLGPTGHGGRRRARGELKGWRAAAEAGDAKGVREVMRENLSLHMLHDAAAIDERALDIHTDACIRTRFRSRAISRAGGLQQMLESFTGPVLLAWGEHDITAFPDEAAGSLGAHCSDATIRIVANAGHWVQYERADDANRLLLEFFAG
jgi:pimeloyl-ACP methyl ester carboxylesterase